MPLECVNSSVSIPPVRRWSILFLAMWVTSQLLFALTDEEKKEQFLNARDGMKKPAAEKKASPSPKPATKAKSTPSPAPKAAPKPSVTPKPAPKQTPGPSPKKKQPSVPKTTPGKKPNTSFEVHTTPIPTPFSTEQELPKTRDASTPYPTPASTPAPTPPPQQDSSPVPESTAPIVIQKSGYEGDAGLEPPPPPPRRGWFFRRAPEENYRFLTASVRNEIRNARVQKRRWRYIVVHNSGTRQGNARIFDYYHRHTRRMPNGLAYHFVIGNGTSSGDGEIEIGERWRRQINGGHVHSDYLNNIALGICLVGDFNRGTPTARQLAALDELIRYLRTRVGKIDRKDAIVKAHRDINPPRWPTDCPGDRFNYKWLYSRFGG